MLGLMSKVLRFRVPPGHRLRRQAINLSRQGDAWQYVHLYLGEAGVAALYNPQRLRRLASLRYAMQERRWRS